MTYAGRGRARMVNDCPTCFMTVPVGFNCEDDQRDKGIDPPAPCENPTKDQVSELERLRKIEEAAEMAFDSIARMGQDVGADEVWHRHKMSRTYNRLREALEPSDD